MPFKDLAREQLIETNALWQLESGDSTDLAAEFSPIQPAGSEIQDLILTFTVPQIAALNPCIRAQRYIPLGSFSSARQALPS